MLYVNPLKQCLAYNKQEKLRVSFYYSNKIVFILIGLLSKLVRVLLYYYNFMETGHNTKPT